MAQDLKYRKWDAEGLTLETKKKSASSKTGTKPEEHKRNEPIDYEEVC